jgi:uncharacterized SAM-binding protein YcdF (DUF218 family)
LSWGGQNQSLITSNYHMKRAQAIATMISGSQSIAVTPLEVPSPRQPLVITTDLLTL